MLTEAVFCAISSAGITIMIRVCAVLTLVFGLVQLSTAAEPLSKDAVKKLATELGEAVMKGDCAKIVDLHLSESG